MVRSRDGTSRRTVLPAPSGCPSADADGSGQCWVTSNLTGNNDVDGGPTTLTTGNYDLSAFGDATITNLGDVTVSGPWTAGGTSTITVGSSIFLKSEMHSHDVLLVRVPLAALRRPHPAQPAVQIRCVSPALFDLVVGRFGLRLLQHQKTVPLNNVPQPRDVSGPTETVYGDDGRCPRADDSVDGAGVEAVCRRIYVGEHRHGTCQAYGLGDLDVPERRHDDLVTCTDTRGPEHSCSPHAADGGRAT